MLKSCSRLRRIQPIRCSMKMPGDDALVPLAISAEQLIAALQSGPSSFHEDEPEEKPLVEPAIEDREPAEFARPI